MVPVMHAFHGVAKHVKKVDCKGFTYKALLSDKLHLLQRCWGLRLICMYHRMHVLPSPA